MKSDLRNLVTAEEAFFSDSTYYTDATNLVTRKSFKNSSGVSVPAVTPGAGYWSATVTHGQLSGATCGIGVNRDEPDHHHGRRRRTELLRALTRRA